MTLEYCRERWVVNVLGRYALPCGCNPKDSVSCAEHAERRTARTWPDMIDAHLDYDYGRPQLRLYPQRPPKHGGPAMISQKNMRTGTGGEQPIRVHEDTPVRRRA